MKAIKAARGFSVPEGSALDRIMAYHGLSYRDAQFIMDLMEEGGFDFEAEDYGNAVPAYDEKAMLYQAGLLIDWTNKNGDWP